MHVSIAMSEHWLMPHFKFFLLGSAPYLLGPGVVEGDLALDVGGCGQPIER